MSPSIQSSHTINNSANFSPQQSETSVQSNQMTKEDSTRQTESLKEATQTKTTEAAYVALNPVNNPADKKENNPFFEKINKLNAEFQEEYKLFMEDYKRLFPNVIAVKNPFWFVTTLKKAYQTYTGTAAVDPFQQNRKILQEAIEKGGNKEEFWEALKKVENGKLLQEPLSNGHLPLNYTILKGNMTAMKVLLSLRCNPEQRDFQSQTAFDVAHVLEKEDMQKELEEFVIGQQQLQFIANARAKGQQIDEGKIAEVFQEIEKQIKKNLAERTIVDPLTLSTNDKIAFVAGIIWMAGQAFPNSSLLHNHYSATYLLPSIAVMSQISEMRHVWENAGHLPTLLSSAATICAMVPSLNFIYKPFKTTMMSLSLLNAFKVTADNYRERSWDSLTKLTVSSFNFYHFWTQKPREETKPKSEPNPEPEDKVAKTAVCKELKETITITRKSTRDRQFVELTKKLGNLYNEMKCKLLITPRNHSSTESNATSFKLATNSPVHLLRIEPPRIRDNVEPIAPIPDVKGNGWTVSNIAMLSMAALASLIAMRK